MIEQRGTVVALAGPPEAPATLVRVRAERASACGGCSADGVCGTSLFDRMLGRRRVLLLARNGAAAAVGDRVVVGISEEGLLGAAMAVYLAPVAALIAGALAGDALVAALLMPRGAGVAAAWVTLLGGSVGFALALFWLRRYSAAVARDPRRHPVVLRRAADRDGAFAVAPPVP